MWGPKSGIFEYSVNGSAYKQVNMFDEWCLGAYRPIISQLELYEEAQSIRLSIRNTASKDERSIGNELRLLKLLVIEE